MEGDVFWIVAQTPEAQQIQVTDQFEQTVCFKIKLKPSISIYFIGVDDHLLTLQRYFIRLIEIENYLNS